MQQKKGATLKRSSPRDDESSEDSENLPQRGVTRTRKKRQPHGQPHQRFPAAKSPSPSPSLLLSQSPSPSPLPSLPQYYECQLFNVGDGPDYKPQEKDLGVLMYELDRIFQYYWDCFDHPPNEKDEILVRFDL